MRISARYLGALATVVASVVWVGCSDSDLGLTTDGGSSGGDSGTGSPIDSGTNEPVDSGSTEVDGSTTQDSGPTPSGCGNGTLGNGETCDDGNTTPGDGCSATCTIEPGYTCTNGANCHAVCGDTVVKPTEGCDDGKADAGAQAAATGCTSTCSVAQGFTCTNGTCKANCGDGVVQGAEVCDNGPVNGEPGMCNLTCSGTVATACGDGRIQPGEGCDDGALNGQQGKCAQGCPVPPVPGIGVHASTFTGNTRGYWFQAPKDFVITSLYVPKDASNAAQSIAVVRMDAAPPNFAATDNAFKTLFVVQASAVDTAIPVKIPVSKDQFIGILGSRGTSNSYRPGPVASTIDGLPVSFARFGFQQALATNLPNNVWTEPSGSISGVEFTYAQSQCGDGVKVGAEECDDGNLAAGDGCSATCTKEPGVTCTEGDVGVLASVCAATCGDGVKAPFEGCDDGAQNGNAGKCDTGCRGVEIGVGTHATLSNASTQGYWFTAASNFVIRGLRVPAAAGAGNQALQVVKLGAAPGTTGPGTNNFVTLAYVRDVAGTNFVDVRVAVKTGDKIGILGGRGAGAALASSVSSAAVSTSIDGQNVTLSPFSFKGSLDSVQAFDVTSAAPGPIGRVEMLWGK